MSLIMFDVDHFRKINDTHGHIAGDYVLRRLAFLLNDKIRKEERFSRYGGEEFVIVMPESAVDRAHTFAEKAREVVMASEFVFGGQDIPVTISLGVGEMVATHFTAVDFLQSIDQALYAAKRGGRNRVERD